MQERIVKGIAGFYYIAAEDTKRMNVKQKDFPQGKLKPLVGDYVEIEVLDGNTGLAVLRLSLPRKNTLIRPAVANIDQALVIFAAKEPGRISHCWTAFW